VNFDDHEIWGAPVHVPEAVPDAPAEAASSTDPTPRASGRLYRSAGSDPHPEAIVALPNHRRHAPAQAGEAVPSAPITINSRIPRATAIEDAAIAEVLATPAAPSTPAGFTSWFRQPSPLAALRNSSATALPSAPESTDHVGGPKPGALQAISGRTFGAPTYAAVLLAITVLVGVIDAAVSSTIGIPTGVALVAATAFGAWRIDAASRWAAWVLPAYMLIAAILVAGQFTSEAPGASPLGQALLVTTELITLAPWLAFATALGAIIPALRKRAA
jgi:hypothetical protein